MTFDSLAYAHHLEAAGIPRPQAEAHAGAVRQFVLPELATAADLAGLESRLENKIETATLRGVIKVGSMLAAAIAINIAAMALLLQLHG
jgi:hypothetical protein